MYPAGPPEQPPYTGLYMWSLCMYRYCNIPSYTLHVLVVYVCVTRVLCVPGYFNMSRLVCLVREKHAKFICWPMIGRFDFNKLFNMLTYKCTWHASAALLTPSMCNSCICPNFKNTPLNQFIGSKKRGDACTCV